MWPDDLAAWFEDYAAVIHGNTTQRLNFYPVLGGTAAVGALVAQALDSAREIALELQVDRDRFTQAQFIAWMQTTVFAEALKLIPRDYRVQPIFMDLSIEERRLLWWYYIDQFSWHQIATLLCTPRAEVRASVARQQVRTALSSLRSLLIRRGRGTDQWTLPVREGEGDL
jgi:hypothetical protein